jgi:hypothetical protein
VTHIQSLPRNCNTQSPNVSQCVLSAVLPREMTSAWTAPTASQNRERHFELLGSRKSCTIACFVRGVKPCAHTSSPVTVDSSNSFPSVRHLGTQGAHTTRHPNSSWTVFAESSERELGCHGQISNYEASIFENQFLHSCYVNTRH